MHDLNTQFANAAISYRNRAATLEAEARELEAELDSPYGRIPGGARVIEGKIERARAEAAYYGRMAAAAGEGLYWLEGNPWDPFNKLFPDLFAQANREGRVKVAPRVAVETPAR